MSYTQTLGEVVSAWGWKNRKKTTKSIKKLEILESGNTIWNHSFTNRNSVVICYWNVEDVPWHLWLIKFKKWQIFSNCFRKYEQKENANCANFGGSHASVYKGCSSHQNAVVEATKRKQDIKNSALAKRNFTPKLSCLIDKHNFSDCWSTQQNHVNLQHNVLQWYNQCCQYYFNQSCRW